MTLCYLCKANPLNHINHSSIKEDNDLPYLINNLNKQHQHPLISKVRTLNNAGDYYVISHSRDCDGTPLYTLANTDKETAIQLVMIMRNGDFNKNYAQLAEALNYPQHIHPDDFYDIYSFLMARILIGYSEESILID